MKKLYPLLLLFFISNMLTAQVVINELDSDTQSIDDLEFIELKTDSPFQSLDGYVVVLFNGSSSGNNSSYFTFDLDSFTTNINGTLVIGSSNVSPVPGALISTNVIQNGADAVAIYQGDYFDFPEGTEATTTNLIDALVYGTGDSDDTDLMALLGISEQIDEDIHNNKEFESIQRNNDGTYFVDTPTPGQLNDGSGVILNGVAFSVPQNQYDEGDSFTIHFTIEETASTDLSINFTLSNGTFDSNDFTGNTSVSIPAGQTSADAQITLIDDADDEGDEVLLINMGNLPNEFVELNDHMEIRVVDNDFTVAAFGTPLNPTYAIVGSTQPNGYYSSLDGLADTSLRQALQSIIAEEGVVRAQTYADIIAILKEADQNPENSNEVWLVYSEQGMPKLDFQTTSDNTGTWNREHCYPRSRGGFYSIDADDIADGPDIYWNTNADSLRHGNSDAHALRAADAGINSSRGNKDYGEYSGPDGNLGSFKGDVARSVFYMAVRYNGLSVVSGNPDDSTVGALGDLDVLLEWHRNDPPDDYEMNRNNIVYTWQYNRNPFIDQPDLVEYIWGNHVGDVWEQLGVNESDLQEISLFPNPSAGKISVRGLPGKSVLEIYSLTGKRLLKSSVENNSVLNLSLPSGIYLAKISCDGNSTVKKLIVQ
ncbi:MAG TPA: endonuclease [Flavobacteriaceae bacterium]|nr:endonuclease [Flavobacteriaceae bacterium]